MWADFPIFAGYDKHEDLRFDSQDCINLFLQKDEGGKKKLAFLNTPGTLFNQTVQDAGAGRALYTALETMYGVFGETVYSFDNTLLKNPLGTIDTDAGYVSIADNNANQVIFISGNTGYTYNGTTFAEISSPGFPANALNVAFLDGYFVVPVGEDRRFYISALNDGTKWDALDFAPIQAYPGNNVGVGVVNRRLFFFKNDSTEVWYNQGAADFPFRRDNNLIFNFGCGAVQTIVSEFGFLFWMASDKNGAMSVMMTTGQTPKKISNPSIDNLLSSMTDVTDVQAYSYKDEGNIFYVMSWTTDDITLVYNLALDIWHRMERNPSLLKEAIPGSGQTRHISSCHTYFNGQHFIGSYINSNLYGFSRLYSTDDDAPIRREWTCKSLFDEAYRQLQINSMQLDMETGIGQVTGDYQNPSAYVRISRDGGHTYGSESPATIGKLGKRQTRVLWRKKGLARDFVPRFSIYAPLTPIAILGGGLNYEVLSK